MLKNKNIVLAITGSISAYKSLELVRLLKEKEANVFVIMSESAKKFVTEISFSALSQNKVYSSIWSDDQQINHIFLARKADVLLVAPASANSIAKCAFGLADDLLTNTFLATTSPVVFAPAMNNNMWENLATQANVETLKQRNCLFIEPEEGLLACNVKAKGRLASLDEIVKYLENILA